MLRDWLRERFEDLGRSTDAEELALYILMLSQGIATLSNALGDRDYVQREVERVENWLAMQCPPANGGNKN
ncbi:hypothetical protein [Cupriavidus sp. 8B]